MKRSHITAGLLGAVLSVGLLLAPVAAANTTTGGSSPEPTATATGTSASAPENNGPADSPEAPKTGSGRSENAPDGAVEDPAAPSEDDAGAVEDPGVPASAEPAPPAAPADPAEPADPVEPADPAEPAVEDPASSPAGTAGAVVAGDPGMTSKNKQYSDEASVAAIHREGCVLTFEVRIGAAGTYTIAVWDDGVQVGAVEVSGAAGEVVTATYTMGANVGTEAWGYDFLLKSGEAKVQYIDWNFEGSEMVMTQCAAAAASQVPVAATSSSKPVPALARTGPAVGLGVLVVLALIGGGLALRRVRHRS